MARVADSFRVLSTSPQTPSHLCSYQFLVCFHTSSQHLGFGWLVVRCRGYHCANRLSLLVMRLLGLGLRLVPELPSKRGTKFLSGDFF